ncbi:hypothetical protein FDP41_013035 [Naegleria fowleri]|uniref:Uncharacterized protein n=1 Tax=Naegleria fowleri TaxID=5763 RepID=A0A6A5BVK7_NAEFO|nr:uncharacterized protein FDP41_013035 [Naegleria fowleri]KAF0981247.1 hypothetical protein FDP41_013035 [Naegleria fowleri]
MEEESSLARKHFKDYREFEERYLSHVFSHSRSLRFDTDCSIIGKFSAVNFILYNNNTFNEGFFQRLFIMSMKEYFVDNNLAQELNKSIDSYGEYYQTKMLLFGTLFIQMS